MSAQVFCQVLLYMIDMVSPAVNNSPPFGEITVIPGGSLVIVNKLLSANKAGFEVSIGYCPVKAVVPISNRILISNIAPIDSIVG